MKNDAYTPDDHHDDWYVIRTIWESKGTVSGFVISAFLASLVFVSFLSETYVVRIPYAVNLYTLEATDSCGRAAKCLHNETKDLLLSGGERWSIKKRQVFISQPDTILPEKNYLAEISAIEKRATEAVLASAEREIDLLNSSVPVQLFQTETVTRRMLDALRIKRAIESDGIKAIRIGSPVIRSASPPYWTILLLGALAGMFAGALFVVGVRHYKETVQTAG